MSADTPLDLAEFTRRIESAECQWDGSDHASSSADYIASMLHPEYLALVAELVAARSEIERLQAEMDRRLDVLQRFAKVWLGTGSDDEQLCMAHDFFSAVLNPPVPGPNDKETPT